MLRTSPKWYPPSLQGRYSTRGASIISPRYYYFDQYFILMQSTEQEWRSLKDQLAHLRTQNQQLRDQLAIANAKVQESQFDLIRSSVQPRLRDNKCSHCQQQPEKSRKVLVQEFQLWSHRLNNNFVMKKHLSELNSEDDSRQDQLPIELPESPRQMKLLERVCLFGPSEQEVLSDQSKKSSPAHQLYYPQRDPLLQVYGNYLYPDRVPVKLIRQKNKLIEIDRIIFRKSPKVQDCNIFVFQCQQEQQGHQQIPNTICRQLNPFRSLYTVALHFNDYLYSPHPYRSRLDRSLSIVEQRLEQAEQPQEELSQTNAKEENGTYGINSVYRSDFCLCIMSYFPFIGFYAELLIHLIDQIKIRRMEQHSKQGQLYQVLDIKYVSQQLHRILQQLSSTLKNFSIKDGNSLELRLGEQQMNLHIKPILREELSGGWAFKMLRLLDRQTLYDIFCLVMLQESICFISDNAHVLTFLIYLFVGLLVRPFSYPHPIVSIVFEEDLLQTPFTAILGINKDNKWLEVNHTFFAQKMDGKIMVNLNDQEVKIRSKKKIKLPKSERLRKIFNNFYKRADKLEGSSKKRDVLSRETTKAQNDLTYQMLQQLEGYFKQQILNYMPNKEIIDSIRSSIIPADNLTTVSTKLIKSIEHYMVESRKRRQHDHFIELLMQKQIFYVYLTNKYDIL